MVTAARWLSHPENRSRGQYRLRLFHFPLATCTQSHRQKWFEICATQIETSLIFLLFQWSGLFQPSFWFKTFKGIVHSSHISSPTPYFTCHDITFYTSVCLLNIGLVLWQLPRTVTVNQCSQTSLSVSHCTVCIFIGCKLPCRVGACRSDRLWSWCLCWHVWRTAENHI